MSKQEFINDLRERLMWLTSEELEKTVNFYSEMIDDRMEEGATEEEAVAALGPMDDITVKIAREVGKGDEAETGVPTATTTVAKNSSESLVLKIVVIAVTFPIWFPVLMGLFGAAIGIVAGLFGACVGVGAGVIAGLGGAIKFFIEGSAAQGFFMLGGFLICLGICIFAWLGVSALCKVTVKGIKNLFDFVKSKFKKEEKTNENI